MEIRTEPGTHVESGSHGIPSAASEPPKGPSVSIVIPTRNEQDNVAPIVARIQAAVKGLDVEVIFVDDSTDDTPAAVREVQRTAQVPVRLLARPPERRNGLGRAVVEGIELARHDWVCVMDGDLQHPPEVIPQLLDHAARCSATLVAASRFASGGGTEGLPFHRAAISKVLTWASKIVFPARLRRISDPLTGFFVVRRDEVRVADLRPEGFKILLEILVRTPALRVAEVPFEFAERFAGASKANAGEATRLFRQVVRLLFEQQAEFVKFVATGLTGLLVNTAAMFLWVEAFGIHYVLSAILATQVSTAWLYWLSDAWVFRGRVAKAGTGTRWGSFFLLNNAALVVRAPLLAVLVASLGLHYLAANLVSLVAMTVVRYVIADRVIWRNRAQVLQPATRSAMISTIASGEDRRP